MPGALAFRGTFWFTDVGVGLLEFCESSVCLMMHRPLDPRLRIEDRLVRLLLVGIQPRRHADLEIPHAEEGRESLPNIILDISRYRIFQIELLTGRGIAEIIAGGQQMAIGIEDRHLLDLHRGNGSRPRDGELPLQ